ncbi:MAG: hypothetical protein M1372_00625, partial [Patescibacteria group bacterium]|nr:hypothetical protein [Patescibacteria group bacterium]
KSAFLLLISLLNFLPNIFFRIIKISKLKSQISNVNLKSSEVLKFIDADLRLEIQDLRFDLD